MLKRKHSSIDVGINGSGIVGRQMQRLDHAVDGPTSHPVNGKRHHISPSDRNDGDRVTEHNANGAVSFQVPQSTVPQ